SPARHRRRGASLALCRSVRGSCSTSRAAPSWCGRPCDARTTALQDGVPMERKTIRLGDTEIARIGLGTNRLTNTPEHVSFIREAVGLGVNMIDTAYLYTGGESEQTIGEA